MNILKTISIFTLSTALIGCGGGSDGGAAIVPPDDGDEPTGGITRSGISAGPVANLGSVIVNGVLYQTDNAMFTIDDAAGSQNDLRVGQYVVVKGEIDDDNLNGSATEVIFDDDVQGPIQSIDTAAGTLVVMGQNVVVDDGTSIDDSVSPPTIEGLSVGQIVEVSGIVAADWTISATRIEARPVGSPFEVHGVVNDLDTAAMSFRMAGLTVDYGGATLDGFDGGQPTEDDFVEAKGSALGPNDELTASRVEAEQNAVAGADGARVELEGLITRFGSASDFDAARVPVTTNSSTVFEGGVAADLALDVKVEVEGDFDAGGTIVATKVDIRRAKVVRVTANADSVDATNNSLVVLGFTVNVDALTRFEDKSNADVEPLTLSDLSANDYLEIRGTEMPAGSGQVLAAIVEREDPDSAAELQGFVTEVNEPSFTILGVTIETGGATVYRDANDNVINSADFFANLSVNSLVKASGSESSATVITAQEIEFEDEN